MPDEYSPITVDMYFDAKAMLPEVLPPQDAPYVTSHQGVDIHWRAVYADPPFHNPLRPEVDPTHWVASWICLNPLVADAVFTKTHEQESQKE